MDEPVNLTAIEQRLGRGWMFWSTICILYSFFIKGAKVKIIIHENKKEPIIVLLDIVMCYTTVLLAKIWHKTQKVAPTLCVHLGLQSTGERKKERLGGEEDGHATFSFSLTSGCCWRNSKQQICNGIAWVVCALVDCMPNRVGLSLQVKRRLGFLVCSSAPPHMSMSSSLASNATDSLRKQSSSSVKK